MIYTLGHRASYLEGIEQRRAAGGSLLKVGRSVQDGRTVHDGGSVWETREDAQAYLDSWRARWDAHVAGSGPYVGASDPHEFSVFGVEADWRRDTYAPKGSEGWRALKEDAVVVVLEEA